jgi:hypothetical protein
VAQLTPAVGAGRSEPLRIRLRRLHADFAKGASGYIQFGGVPGPGWWCDAVVGWCLLCLEPGC